MWFLVTFSKKLSRKMVSTCGRNVCFFWTFLSIGNKFSKKNKKKRIWSEANIVYCIVYCATRANHCFSRAVHDSFLLGCQKMNLFALWGGGGGAIKCTLWSASRKFFYYLSLRINIKLNIVIIHVTVRKNKFGQVS